MPVRRLPGGRGRVVADTRELDAWKSLAPPDDAQEGEPAEPAAAPAGLTRRSYILPVASALLAAALPGYLGLRRTPRPAAGQVRERSLLVLDERGRELWDYVSDRPLRSLSPAFAHDRDRLWFGDLDGDGQTEVLWARHPRDCPPGSPSLLCFSERGRVKWEYVPSRTVATRRQQFAPPYDIRAIKVGDLGGGRGTAVALSISHHRYHPSAVVLLTPRGEPAGEYWHSGHLTALRIGDLDGDGKVEICAAGTSNSTGEATLLLLDPGALGGASSESDPDYQLVNLAPAAEKRRVLFPRSCVNRATHVRNSAWEITGMPGEITVEVREGLSIAFWASIYYHFGHGMELRNVEFSDSFRISHQSLEKRRLLDHAFSPGEAAPLRALREVAVKR